MPPSDNPGETPAPRERRRSRESRGPREQSSRESRGQRESRSTRAYKDSTAAKTPLKSRLKRPLPPWWFYVPAAVLLLIYFFSAITAVSNKSTTFDELFHLTGGYSYWLYGDFRLQPENGNLPQRWAALPLLFSGTKFPSIDSDTWRAASMADVGEQFFYHVGNDADAILFQGRTMIAMLGTALGALVFAWTRRLLGALAGLVSLMLNGFCPTVLTNGALTTSDMAAALFFVASLGCIWRVLHRVSWQTVVVSSLVMGLLFVSKFSAPMIVPMGLLLMACQLASRQPTLLVWRGRQTPIVKRRWRLPVQLATIAVHGVIVWCVIWTFYNFRYEMFANTTRQVNPEGQEVVVDRPSIP